MAKDKAKEQAKNQSESQTKSQYQHFIPRFILKNFARGKPGEREHGKVNVMDLDKASLYQRPTAKHFGLEDMYRDVASENQQEIEEKLSELERRASRIIHKAVKTFDDPGAVLTLTRPERSDLRKFLFIMKYRNERFYARFNCDTIEEYVASDKERLKAYMERRGLTVPRHVWTENLRAFIDLDMDAGDKWTETLQNTTYEDDAKMLAQHVQHTYMVFCRPRHEDQGFLLTENAYGIFEGVQKVTCDPETGKPLNERRTEWHNFAPISPSLIIILRSNLLPRRTGDNDSDAMLRSTAYDISRILQGVPQHKKSLLHDMPVAACQPSYVTILNGKTIANQDFKGRSDKDQFFFRCFSLPPSNVNTINSLLLDEARATSTIVYKNPLAAARAIESYLEDGPELLKVVLGDDKQRSTYYRRLETLVSALDPRPTVDVRCKTIKALDPSTHMSSWVGIQVCGQLWAKTAQGQKFYKLLGGVDDRSLFHDMQQACLMAFMANKIDIALIRSRLVKSRKDHVKALRLRIFETYIPTRRFWLYLKIMRNLPNFDKKDFKIQTSPLSLEGPEDMVTSLLQTFAELYKSEAMFCAFQNCNQMPRERVLD